jgi:hypothetical protein
MNSKNSGRLFAVLHGMKVYFSGSTRNFLALKFLRRAIRLGKRATLWERAALEYDPDLPSKIDCASSKHGVHRQ